MLLCSTACVWKINKCNFIKPNKKLFFSYWTTIKHLVLRHTASDVTLQKNNLIHLCPFLNSFSQLCVQRNKFVAAVCRHCNFVQKKTSLLTLTSEHLKMNNNGAQCKYFKNWTFSQYTGCRKLNDYQAFLYFAAPFTHSSTTLVQFIRWIEWSVQKLQ